MVKMERMMQTAVALTLLEVNEARNTYWGSYGGGIYSNEGDVDIYNCTIEKNINELGTGRGGGMFLKGGEVEIWKCKISENKGDGIYYHTYSDPASLTIRDSIISDNEKSGIYSPWEYCPAPFYRNGRSYFTNTITIMNSNISNNKHHGAYIGLQLCHPDAPFWKVDISHCTISGNRGQAQGKGSIVIISPQDNRIWATIDNCIITGNTADKNQWGYSYGGGIYANEKSWVEIENCTIAENRAIGTNNKGGGIYYNSNGCSGMIINDCILWNNTANDGPQIYQQGTGYLSVAFSDVEGGLPLGAFDGGGNIYINPMFVLQGYWDGDPSEPEDQIWIEGDYHLQSNSPCIDAGDPSFTPGEETDMDGEPRVADGDGDDEAIIDMGADEYYGLWWGLWWPMFHHDPENTGFSTSTAPETNTTLWINETDDSIVSSPAVVDGYVYVGSNDGKLYCFDVLDGTEKWSFMTQGAVRSSPAVVDGKVYVGSDDHKIYCLNASDGSHIWNFTTDGSISSSPVVVDGKVLIGSILYGGLYCLDAVPDDNDDGIVDEDDNDEGLEDPLYATYDILWIYEPDGWVTSSPAVDENSGYVVVIYPNSARLEIHKFNLSNGNCEWYNQTSAWGGYISGDIVSGGSSSPTVVDGFVYVGTDSGDVLCFYDSNGTLKWKAQIGDGWISSPAVAYNKVYVGQDDSSEHVVCLNSSDGSEQWTVSFDPFEGRVISSPAIADGKIYIGSEDHKIYCLNSETGNPVWDYITGGSVRSSPALADGNVYIASTDGYLYAFGELTL